MTIVKDFYMAGVCEVCGSDPAHASDLEVIRHDIAELRNTVNTLIFLIEPIQKELGPMLDDLANGPIGKMMGLSKKEDKS